MDVLIMYRSNFDGGDGWDYHPMRVNIANICPACGEQRGKPYPYRFCEDGEWFTVERWDNPCGHIDKYADCYREHKQREAAVQMQTLTMGA